MSDEQIKQNADAYAGSSTKHLQQPYEEYKLKYNAYIAGAHSCDEEIRQLKNALSSAQRRMIELIEIL